MNEPRRAILTTQIDLGKFTSQRTVRDIRRQILTAAEHGGGEPVVIFGQAPDVSINLSDLRLGSGPLPPLEFRDCDFEALDLSGSYCTRLALRRARFERLAIVDAKLEASLELEEVNGPQGAGCHINLAGTRVEGNLRVVRTIACRATRQGGFLASECALFAQSVSVRGNLVLAGLAIDGPLALNGAQVSGSVALHDLQGGDGTGLAINAESISVQGTFGISASRLSGLVTIQNGFIDGSLNATSGVFEGVNGVAFRAEGASIKGSILFYEATFRRGCVSLLGAEIEGTLDLDGAVIDITGAEGFSPQNVKAALDIETARISGHVYMRRGTRITGTVLASTSVIHGSIDIADAALIGVEGPSMIAGLDASSALWVVNSQIDGSIKMRRSQIEGDLDVVTCKMGGSAEFEDIVFTPLAGKPMHARLDDSTIARTLSLTRLSGHLASFSLHGASCVSFDDAGTEAWSALTGRINFDGFTYDRLERHAGSAHARARISLLLRAAGEIDAQSYRPQPFKRLAHVLDQLGDPVGARLCLSKKRQLEQKLLETWLTRPISALFGLLFDYGLSVTRAITSVAIALLFCVSLVVAADGPANLLKYQEGDKVTKDACSEHVDLAWMAIDLFMPVIDLRAASKCVIAPPEGEKPLATLPFNYAVSGSSLLRFGIGGIQFLGWVMVSGLLLTLSGALRRT